MLYKSQISLINTEERNTYMGMMIIIICNDQEFRLPTRPIHTKEIGNNQQQKFKFFCIFHKK